MVVPDDTVSRKEQSPENDLIRAWDHFIPSHQTIES